MEVPPEEVFNTNATTNANPVLKGKRTKRQRVQSPIPFALTANSSSGDGDGDVEGDDCTNNINNTDDIVVKNSSTNYHMSPTLTTATSQEFQESTTDEEEDMANCLILLAQGHSNKDSPKQDDHNDVVAGVYNPIITTTINNNNKFNSRRFLETAGSPSSGKAGYYVYECKTCNRTFPSFQALGGHRASHKKPKAMTNNIIDENYGNKKQQFAISSDEEDAHYKDISSLSLQLSNNNNVNTNSNANRSIYSNTKAKIHECSVCGAEFNSGQALGGHMRRHRAPIGSSTTMTNASTTTLLLTPMARIESEEPKKARNLLSLDLDLNLPAPEDEKLHFASKQQQQQQQKQQQEQQPKPPLVFSSPALVDCHY